MGSGVKECGGGVSPVASKRRTDTTHCLISDWLGIIRPSEVGSSSRGCTVQANFVLENLLSSVLIGKRKGYFH